MWDSKLQTCVWKFVSGMSFKTKFSYKRGHKITSKSIIIKRRRRWWISSYMIAMENSCTWTRTRSSDLKEEVQSCSSSRRRRRILKKKLLAFMETTRYWITRRSSDLPCMGRIWRCPNLGKKRIWKKNLGFWAFSLWEGEEEEEEQQQQQGGLILGAWVQSEWWVVVV